MQEKTLRMYGGMLGGLVPLTILVIGLVWLSVAGRGGTKPFWACAWLALAGLAAGDQEALGQLYHRTRTAVYGLALSILRHGHDAEDVTQDTFVRAWEKAEQYRPQGTPMAWLLAIARNLALMKLRERARTQDLPPEDWESFAIDSHDVTTEDRTVLTAALSTLSDEERQIIMLHVTAGLKHREIAQLLELPLSTVLSKYRRALSKLKQKLEGGDAR